MRSVGRESNGWDKIVDKQTSQPHLIQTGTIGAGRGYMGMLDMLCLTGHVIPTTAWYRQTRPRGGKYVYLVGVPATPPLQ